MTTARVHTTLLACASLTLINCTEAECATPDYTRAECRVLAEDGFARALTNSGVEVRMQAADATDAEAGWLAHGLVREREGRVNVRVAHMGDFALSLRASDERDASVALTLTNLHPRAELRVGPLGEEALSSAAGEGPRRELEIEVPAGEVVWIRGNLACTERYRLIALADIQTNPTHFSRIIDRIQTEAQDAAAAGELLTGVLVAGDLTESSVEDEFRIFADLLEPVPVPFALTPGNHDVYESHLPYFNQNFGPGNYGFDICTTHVAMLDSGSGAVATSVIGRLPELFDPGDTQLQIAAMHHAPYPGLTSAGWSDEDLAAITLGEFAYQGGDLVLAGHAHMLRDFPDLEIAGATMREIIAGTAGAWQGAGPPIYGYIRLTIEGGDYETCFVEVPPPGALPQTVTPTTIPLCTDP
ncbi:metallophosphoesterase [Pseudenhygromyxa sp. WMMC2535]|uniref:metallophosphoesterase family protein n=1 Tax=Pseudenhygromyxa sp. WMMC2535 TaxID=2712867 RepID=UPI001552EAC2|nr:metallophosphoesterase [Pseudenhygromyxa sp. WMMC2535]NVB39297.1 metallophosphoesterase [Pseudenhygromyxa sp. WMMC2535]